MALQTTIEKLYAARKAYDDQLKSLGKDLGQEAANHLGALLPEGFVLEWRQGTPSFNDGDPCRFRVRDGYIYRVILNEHGKDPYEGDHPEDRGYRNGKLIPQSQSFYLGSSSYGRDESLDGLSVEQFNTLSAAWRALPADLMERAFGDGANVRVFSGGKYIATEYYE